MVGSAVNVAVGIRVAVEVDGTGVQVGVAVIGIVLLHAHKRSPVNNQEYRSLILTLEDKFLKTLHCTRKG
jgi:hypothetical protein